ncbi:MAG: AI-2E family transporter [Acetobacter sp.]|jgi:predicted PurR-regulated permease PerM|nr:AI-2E family transporter [Acetobacter sp.]MCH4059997.1 AI-2E family transporter [Acetobacter sp.]MCH4086938.1 AI-2E family transporter [Acetobacter sp.]MCI1294769.1 AI-2E family transporter [Acetobacter sp.]MCI1320892.1 AI-2E family transporter [Acetobacter sp.]
MEYQQKRRSVIKRTCAEDDACNGCPQDRIARLLSLVVALVVLVVAIWLIGDVLLVVFSAALCAVILNGLARFLERRLRLSYSLSLAVVCVTLLLVSGTVIWSSGPALGTQLNNLRDALTSQIGLLQKQFSSSPQGQMLLHYIPLSGQGGLESIGTHIAGSMTGLLGSAFGAVGTIFVVIVAGIYFAISPSLYARGVLRMVPADFRPTARMIMDTAGRTLQAWMAGQALDMIVVGVLTGIGLWIIGVPLALGLGVLAGLCNFIPYIGAIMGAVPAVLIALSLGIRETLLVAGLYAVVQFFEGNVLAPVIQRHAVRMPPAVAVLSQSLCGAVFGFPGLILASPLTAVLLAVGDVLTPPLPPEPDEDA